MEVEKDLEETNKKKKWLILLLLLLLLIGGAGGYFWYQSHQQSKTLVAGDFPDVKDAHKMTQEQRKAYGEQQEDATQFTLTIFPEATFNHETSEGSIYVKNEPVNVYPINVKVLLDDTNEQVYETGMIQPGYEVSKGTLDKPLQPGVYKATAHVDIYDNASKAKRGTTQAAIAITVE